ncbi:MAG: hypothetical protein NC418_10405 [Muribaculaceae bacterium]|nr:hypothetical protein [Muribaculaceae bacterium]
MEKIVRRLSGTVHCALRLACLPLFVALISACSSDEPDNTRSGKIIKQSDEYDTIEYSYDSQGRLSRLTRYIGSTQKHSQDFEYASDLITVYHVNDVFDLYPEPLKSTQKLKVENGLITSGILEGKDFMTGGTTTQRSIEYIYDSKRRLRSYLCYDSYHECSSVKEYEWDGNTLVREASSYWSNCITEYTYTSTPDTYGLNKLGLLEGEGFFGVVSPKLIERITVYSRSGEPDETYISSITNYSYTFDHKGRPVQRFAEYQYYDEHGVMNYTFQRTNSYTWSEE